MPSSPTTSVPVALLPDLFELETNLPADPAAFFTAALDPSAAPMSGARAAAAVLRFAASEGLEPAALGQQLRAVGLGEAAAAFFADYWALQPPRSAVQLQVPMQLRDVEWSFGVSASSSEHQAMGTTFVQMRLNVQGEHGAEYVHTGTRARPRPRSARILVLAPLSFPCAARPSPTRLAHARHSLAVPQSSTSRASTISCISSSKRRQGWTLRERSMRLASWQAAARLSSQRVWSSGGRRSWLRAYAERDRGGYIEGCARGLIVSPSARGVSNIQFIHGPDCELRTLHSGPNGVPVRVGPTMASYASARKKEAKKKEAPELQALLEARDYTGAITLIEFESKMFMDKKQASGWRAGANGEYEWVEGGSSHLTGEEAKQDEERMMWLAYAAFHLGDYGKALDTYQMLLEKGSDDPMVHVFMGCCLERMQMHQEADERASKGTPGPLQNRLLFHLAHRMNDESKLMMHHQKLADTTLDQLSLASIHFLRNHFQEATDIYKRLLLENRDFTALNVYVALCYYKLDYYDVSLEILAAYLQAHPDSAIALNLKACNQFRLYDGKAAEAELQPLTKEAVSVEKIKSNLVRHNMVVFQNGERALQILPALVGVVPEARLNLVIYHMHNGEVQEAFELMKDVEPASPSEYILKGVTNLAVGQAMDSREHLKVAQQYFQLLGASASEYDTIPGRQCMASCFFILRQFDDVLIYLSSIEAYFPSDPTFLYNFAIAKAAAGKYKDAEPALLALQAGSSAEELTKDYIFQMWLARCLVMNGKARQAWEIYLKMEGTQESFAMLQLLANDCYRAGAFLYAAKAFDTLERLDPNPEYWDGKRGACVGAFQKVVANEEQKGTLREILGMLKSSRNPQVEYLARVMKKWARENGVSV